MWQWLGYLCLAIIAIPFSLIVLKAVYTVCQYHVSPEYFWCRRVLLLHRHIERRLERETREMNRHGITDPDADNEVLTRWLTQHLKNIDVGILENYPGIGPGTIQKLRSARYKTIADLHTREVDIAGLGQKRTDEVEDAAQEVIQDAREAFLRGECPEAIKAEEEIQQLRAERSPEGARAIARVHALRKVRWQLQPALDIASQFTALEFFELRGLGKTLQMLPLPDLDAALRDVDRPQEARPAPKPVDLFEAELRTASVANGDKDLENLKRSVQFAYLIAKADGKVSRRERDMIRDRFGRGRSDETRRLIDEWGESFAQPSVDIAECLKELIYSPKEQRRSLYEFAAGLAGSDRGKKKQELLDRVSRDWGLSDPFAESDPAAAPLPDPKAVLEIDSTTPVSADLVRRQYNLLMDRYAEPRFADLDGDFVRLAKRKRDLVEQAASSILADLKESLVVPEQPVPSDIRHNPDLDAIFD